jgi:hypothetical protein
VGGAELGTSDTILVLHYLLQATGAPLRGDWIAFRQLPGGEVYLEPFRKRTVDLLVRCFGRDPQRLLTAARALGGEELGGYRVAVRPLPRVPLVLTLWPGDEEVPTGANVLYDASAPLYLPTEDLVVLATNTILELNRAA